jgi:hypothetical protein
MASTTCEPVTHDYTRRGWGHDYAFETNDGGQSGEMTGWGRGIREGDFLLLAHPASRAGSSRYRVDKITYRFDPNDMWNAKVTFAPRTHT